MTYALATETDVRKMCQLVVVEYGGRLWRNNSGALPDSRGVPVRFGLGNDSARTNVTSKSADLVGILRPRGQLVGVECKEPGWRPALPPPSGRPASERYLHELAQGNWLALVRSMGGIADFIDSEQGFRDLMTQHGYRVGGV